MLKGDMTDMRWYNRLWRSIDVFFRKAATQFAIKFLLIGVVVGVIMSKVM